MATIDELILKIEPHEPEVDRYPIRVVLTGNCRGTEVFIGDFKVPRLVDVALEHKTGEFPVLTLKIAARDGAEIIGLSQVLADCRVDQVIGWRERRKAEAEAEAVK